MALGFVLMLRPVPFMLLDVKAITKAINDFKMFQKHQSVIDNLLTFSVECASDLLYIVLQTNRYNTHFLIKLLFASWFLFLTSFME